MTDAARVAAGDEEGPRLVARIRTGDERALEQAFLAYAGSMHRIAYRHLGSAWAARAVVQDVFTSLWDRRATVVVQGSLGAYLNGAVRKRSLSVLREEMRRRERDGRWVHLSAAGLGEQSSDSAGASHGSLTDSDQVHGAVERALAELPPRQRTVFRLRVERHLSNAEVRDAIGAVSVKAVELLYSRAIKTLRARLLPQLAELDPEWEGGRRAERP